MAKKQKNTVVVEGLYMDYIGFRANYKPIMTGTWNPASRAHYPFSLRPAAGSSLYYTPSPRPKAP